MGWPMKLLILEDHELLRKMIYDMLKRHFPSDHIISYSNGEDAIEEIKKSPVDIAVIDIHLPGKNGMQITQQLRITWPDAIIIIYTNYDIPEYRDNSIKSGADYFLSKESHMPYDLVQLIKSTIA